MTEPEDEDIEAEYYPAESIILHDDSCWVSDPDALAHDSEASGVIAVLYRGGGLWFLDGETRQWYSAEKDGAKKARPASIRPVN